MRDCNRSWLFSLDTALLPISTWLVNALKETVLYFSWKGRGESARLWLLKWQSFLWTFFTAHFGLFPIFFATFGSLCPSRQLSRHLSINPMFALCVRGASDGEEKETRGSKRAPWQLRNTLDNNYKRVPQELAEHCVLISRFLLAPWGG